MQKKINNRKIKKGISLITLIITIIVIIILAGAIIVSLIKNNIISEASNAKNLQEIKAVEEAINLYKVSNVDTNGNYNSNYPVKENVGAEDIDDIMKERISTNQGGVLIEDIDYARLGYLDFKKLGLNNISSKKYFVDTGNDIIYINGGIKINNTIVYTLNDAIANKDEQSSFNGKIYAYENNTYVIKENNEVYGLGETGLYNQLLLPSSNVYDITNQSQLTSIVLDDGDRIYKNRYVTIILKNNGDVYGVGGNTNGELGLGDTSPRYTLTKLPLSNIKDICVTFTSIFALTNQNELEAAGSNSNKTIKDSDELIINKFTNITYNLDGTENNKISDIKMIAANGHNVYVELENGEVWCWGLNQFNVLKNGSGYDNKTILPMKNLEIENLKNSKSTSIKKIDSTNGQCTFVLLENGELYSKGYTQYDGITNSITGQYSKVFENVKDVVCFELTSHLLTNDGYVYAWGTSDQNYHGLEGVTYNVPTKLNLSNIAQISGSLVLSNSNELYNIGKSNGVLNEKITNVHKIKKVYFDGLSIDEQNRVWIRGDNSYGQLMLKDKGSKNILIKCNVKDIVDIESESANQVVLDKNGKIYGTGLNLYNQINPTSKNNVIDVTNINFSGTVIDYDLSERNLYVIDSNNDLWSVGNNSYGQMGETGVKTQLTKFTAQNLKFSKVYAKGRSVIALTTDNKLYACGQDDYGVLGLGAGTGVFGSSRIAKYTQITTDIEDNNIDFSILKKIDISDSFSAMLMNDGKIYVTGINASGQLGLGDYNFKNKWTKNNFFEDKAKVIDIGAGSDFIVFLLENGDVYTVGNNSYGQLGNGTNTPSNIPVKVNISNVKSIAVGSGHVVAVKEDNTIWSFGKGSHGQLGTGKIARDENTPQRAYELEK